MRFGSQGATAERLAAKAALEARKAAIRDFTRSRVQAAQALARDTKSAKSTERLATEFFGKQNVGKSIEVDGKVLPEHTRTRNSGYARIVDGRLFGTKERLQGAVLHYAKELAGKPFTMAVEDGKARWFAQAKRPDGTKCNVIVRERSKTAKLDGANVELTLEVQDPYGKAVRVWDRNSLELKFNW